MQNGKPQRIPVTIGISDGMYSEVVSGDVGEDQEVIVESSSRPINGAGPNRPSSIPRFIR